MPKHRQTSHYNALRYQVHGRTFSIRDTLLRFLESKEARKFFKREFESEYKLKNSVQIFDEVKVSTKIKTFTPLKMATTEPWSGPKLEVRDLYNHFSQRGLRNENT
jgi:hypothetical protein